MSVDSAATTLVSWLATYAVHSTIIFGAAWLATAWLTERFDAGREMVWKSALALSVISPALQIFLYSRDAMLELPVPTVSLDQTLVYPAGVELSWPLLLATVWIAGALIGLAQLAKTHYDFRDFIADRRALSTAERRSLLPAEESSARISVARNLIVPVALSNEVCLPEWALQSLSPGELRTVIAHERAHVQRRDTAWRWAAAVATRIFFFQPLNRVASARLRELAECLCDEAAVLRTGNAVALASALGATAPRVARGYRLEVLAPSFASSESLTLRRVRRMLSTPTAGTGTPAPSRLLACTASTAALTLLTAFAPRVEPTLAPLGPYTVQAHDPAGPFTLTIHRGRVVSATIAGNPVPASGVRQRGLELELAQQGTSPFSLKLTPQGGIVWKARIPEPANQ